MAEQAQEQAASIDLVGLTKDICLQLLDETMASCPDSDAISLGLDSSLSASIPLHGDFEGALAVDVSLPMADQFAAKMMLVEPGQLMHEEVCDGIGEIANVIAGGVKQHLSAGTQLDPPSVVQDVDYTLTYPDCNPVAMATFAWNGEIMQVTLLERA